MSEIIRALLRNSAFAFAAKTATQLGSVFLFLVVARVYSTEETGIYTLALRYTGLFLVLAIGGLDSLLIWQVSSNRSLTTQFLLNFGLVRLVCGIVAYLSLALLL